MSEHSVDTSYEAAMHRAAGHEVPLLEAHPYRRTNGLELGPPVTLEQAKAAHVARVLDELAWNLTEAALVLAVDRRTMHRLVKRYGLSRPARVFSRAT